MAKPTTSERVRLFVALDLPDGPRRAIARWRDELVGGSEELRPVAEEALHVTLAFLGWRDAAEVELIAAALPAPGPAPRLTPSGLTAVPPRRPRLLALDLADQHGRAGALQAAVAGALADGGFYEPESRPFWPHVTLARVRKGARLRPPAAAPPPGRTFDAAALTLYRSRLRHEGASYEPLHRIPTGR